MSEFETIHAARHVDVAEQDVNTMSMVIEMRQRRLCIIGREDGQTRLRQSLDNDGSDQPVILCHHHDDRSVGQEAKMVQPLSLL